MECDSAQSSHPVRLVCSQHPASSATWACTECGQSWCRACVRQIGLGFGKTVAICPTCQGLCERFSALAVRTEPRSFASGLIESLSFPFQGSSLVLLVAGTALEIVASSLGRLFLFGGLFMLAGLGLG